MIKITDKYYICADNKCYVLKERTEIKDPNSENYGKEKFKELGYFTSLETVLQGIVKLKILEYVSKNEINDLKELKQEIIKQTEYIKSLNLNV